MLFEPPIEIIHFSDCIQLLKPEKCELYETNRNFRLVCLRLKNNKCLYFKITERLKEQLLNKNWITDLLQFTAIYWGKVKNPIIWLSLGFKPPERSYFRKLEDKNAFTLLNQACFIETNLFTLARNCDFDTFDIRWATEDEDGNGDYSLLCESKKNNKSMRIKDVYFLPNDDTFDIEIASKENSPWKVIYKENTPWVGKFWALPSWFELKSTHQFS